MSRFVLHPRILRRFAALLAIALCADGPIYAADKSPTTSDNADQKAILAAIDSYVDAYNRGDAKAVAAHWARNGEWISPDGERFIGRQAIEKEMTSLFSDEHNARIAVFNPSVRFISPDVAIEEATVRVIHPAQPPAESTYIAVDVKEGGKWKLNTVRETEVPESEAPTSQLQELAWLVGDWVDDSPEADDVAKVVWTKNKMFLNYTFKISAPGMDDLEGTQVVGWDPASRTIRSWMFDSDGGIGEGAWSKHEDSWVVKFSQVLPDGHKATATNVYTMVNANTFTWKSIGRKVDGEFMPNVDEVKMVRRTSPPARAVPEDMPEKVRKRASLNK